MDDINSLKKRIVELEKSNRELKDVFDAVGDIVFVLDRDNVVIKANDACASFLGIKTQDIIGKKCHELMHGKNKPWPECPFEKTKRDKRVRTEEVSDSETGRSLLVTVSPVFNDRGEMVAVVHSAKDVTEYNRTAEALCEEEVKYKTVFESSADAIMLLTPGGKFSDGNDAAVKLFGFQSKEEIISRTPFDLSPEYQPDGQLSYVKAQEMMRLAIEKGSIFFEWKHKRVSGEEFFARVLLTSMELGTQMVLQATVRDVTERRNLEASLKRQGLEVQIILDSVPAWIFYKDRENRFIRVNKAFADVMQMPKEELEGKSGFDLYPREQAQAYLRDDREVIDSGKAKTNIIEFMDTKKGRLWVHTDKIPYRNEKGDIIGVICFSTDITERKLSEQALAKKLRDLEIFYKAAVDREMKMKELKQRIKELESQTRG